MFRNHADIKLCPCASNWGQSPNLKMREGVAFGQPQPSTLNDSVMNIAEWTDLKRKRYDDIDWVIKEYGIQLEDKYIMSLWDLAHHINNTWKAEKFITDKSLGEQKAHGFVVHHYNLYGMSNAIKHGVRDSDIEYKKAENGTRYLVKKIDTA